MLVRGVDIGQTPVFLYPLRPGTHRVTAIREDGAEKDFTITITDGGHLESGQVPW